MRIKTYSSDQKDTLAAANEACGALKSDGPTSLVIAFSNAEHDASTLVASLNESGAPYLLATSCLGSLLCDESRAQADAGFSVLSIFDETGAFGVGSADCSESDAFTAGASALEKALINAGRPFESPSLIWCALPPGEEEAIINGFTSVVGEQVPIFGGSAADNTVEGNWYIGTSLHTGTNCLAVAVLYPSSPLGLSYSSGYKPTGTVFKASKAQNRHIIELNGVSAATAYNNATNGLITEQMAGGQILGLTSTAPLGKPVQLENGALNYLLCHPDEVCEDGALSVFSEVIEGEELVLMEGSIASLTARAERVINNAIMLLPDGCKPVGVLLVYCAGCRLTVGNEIHPMLTSLREKFESLPICGTYTFGEQGRFLDGKSRHGNLMISAVVFSQ
ncbi:FIST signal transduction protein [Alteromonas sp. A081]|uniref:FIST signal transduction protein n=1 Tax=Alteromonas sp. A081 TaxID=3410269 RepID=UPI003B9842B3